MRSLLPALLLAARGGALLLPACGGEKAQTVTVAGSSTVLPLMELVAERFEATHPGVRVDVQGGGSSVGVRSVQSGLADIGMVSRDLTPEEAAVLSGHVLARDGVGVVVHADNTVQGLTRRQVREIYTRAHTDWSSFGAAPGPITVVGKEEGRATRIVFEEGLDLVGEVGADIVIIGPNGQAIQTVAGNPGAIAYVSIGAVEAARAQGVPVRLLALDGVAASVDTVRDGSWPLERSLLLVTSSAAPDGAASALLRAALGPEGRAAAAELGFVEATGSPP